MKYELPDNHGLSDSVLSALVFKEGEQPALTDAQHAALQAGVGRGDSVLVVSPTSTGKTHIALWAIARSLEIGHTTVYLVTHRALARQKFEEFKTLLFEDFLGNNGAALVIATGDSVENADGDVPADPLRAPLLVATYEKYLGLLSGSGIPADMSTTVVICDEIQLIGDEHRGQNVEVLLTLLRNAHWKQFVGLSAVLESRDAQELADWLGVTLVVQHTREKHLRYECWTPNGIAVVTSETPDQIEEGIAIPEGVNVDTISIIGYLLEHDARLPIIVFCMRKRDTYDLANAFLDKYGKKAGDQLSLDFDGLPETAANAFLAVATAQRIAVHNADLMDEERQIVEQRLLEGKIDVVFATSTLAAGVNFPFGSAVFSSWMRWDGDRRDHVPIESSEFHNMAGRVGRMGYQHTQGRVVFTAYGPQIHYARRYLDLAALPSMEPRVDPGRFNQLALQLVASGLCASRSDVETLVCSTFSGVREEYRNNAGFLQWSGHLSNAIHQLVAQVLLIESSVGKLVATPIGKAVAYSGLLPETGVFLLNYVASKMERLTKLLPGPHNDGDMPRLAFLLYCACFSSPEFRPTNGKASTRFLPWPLSTGVLFDADAYQDDLPEPVWNADVAPINAAELSRDWINGDELRDLERLVPQVTAGMLRDMFRELVWVLDGFASITTAAADTRTPEANRPRVLRGPDAHLDLLARLPRIVRRLSFRVGKGLPDDVLWMTGLNVPGSEFKLSRSEILSLQDHGFTQPQQVMLGSPEADQVRLAVFAKAKPTPQAKANWLRDACREWKMTQRRRAAERHLKRARRCPDVRLVEEFYGSNGTDFERAFEEILQALKVTFDRLDDKTKTGAPDYLLQLEDSPPLIVELKSKEGDKLVDYNKAVEVLAASEVHGHKETFCVTLCHPGVDPSVPLVIVECGRLSVVESSDLGEALLRLCEGSLTQNQLYAWLATPGQALVSDLPFRDYSLAS